MTERNGIIEKTILGIDDGPLLAWLMLRFQGSAQGFGGYSLEKGAASFWIRRVLETVGVVNWEDLKGKHLRVRHDVSGLGGNIIAIGHIIDDKWFYPREEFLKEFPRD